MGTCVHFSRSLPSNSWWQTMVGCQVLSRPSAAEGGGRRPAFTGPATQPYSATEVDGWQQLSRVSQNRAAVQLVYCAPVAWHGSLAASNVPDRQRGVVLDHRRQLPYDSFAGDMVHGPFHMWQQSNCGRSARSI